MKTDHAPLTVYQYIDVRVRVPHGMRVTMVLWDGPTSHGPATIIDQAPAPAGGRLAMPDPSAVDVSQPIFYGGKTYRTIGGHIMKIERISDGDMIGKQVRVPPIQSHGIVYDYDGKAKGAGWQMFDLIPGAVEDDKPSDGPVLVTMKVLREETAATDARLDRLSGIIDDHDKRLTAIEAASGCIQIPNITEGEGL